MEIEGLGAVKGTASGVAKLPSDPTFKEGDILVAEMTVPKDVPIMKLASAIATDIGSITCHAAIVAREMGKPCIVRAKVNAPNGAKVTDYAGKLMTISVKGIREATATIEEEIQEVQ
jgi:phosphoenolpyruvate synthase/pyruvate phosphate dikinase